MAKKDPIKTAVNLITASTYDSLLSDLNKLKLDHESYQSVVDLIERKKEESMFEVKKKKGHAVPADRRCKNESNGKQCGSFMSDKDVGLCWVHMSENQKGIYHIKREKRKEKKGKTLG